MVYLKAGSNLFAAVLWNYFFYKEELLRRLPLSYHVYAFVYVSYIKLFFYLLINLLYIYKLGIV